MAPRQPPRFVVRTLGDAAHERRRQLIVGVVWLASLALAAAIGMWLARAIPSSIGSRRFHPSATEDELRQQVAILQRAAQVSDVATRELKRNLAERDEEISGLRTDLAFYSRLVGGSGQRDGLRIQTARTTPVKDSPRAWNLVVTLTQKARRGDGVAGTLHLSVDGIEGDKTVRTLDGAALGQADDHRDPAFSFKYFQQVQETFTLPAGFQPTRLRLTAATADKGKVEAVIPWTDATRNEEIDDVQR